MRRLTAVLVVLCSVLGGPHLAAASFGTGATASASFAAGSLAAPSGLVASNPGCSLIGLKLLPRVRLTWAVTPTAWAQGYVIERSTSGSSGPYSVVTTVSGRATTTVTLSGLAALTTYWHRIRATYGSWQSASSNAVGYTTPLLC